MMEENQKKKKKPKFRNGRWELTPSPSLKYEWKCQINARIALNHVSYSRIHTLLRCKQVYTKYIHVVYTNGRSIFDTANKGPRVCLSNVSKPLPCTPIASWRMVEWILYSVYWDTVMYNTWIWCTVKFHSMRMSWLLIVSSTFCTFSFIHESYNGSRKMA